MKDAVDAGRSDRWDHTAELLAMLLNCAAKKHVTSGRKMHPLRKHTPKPLILGDLEALL